MDAKSLRRRPTADNSRLQRKLKASEATPESGVLGRTLKAGSLWRKRIAALRPQRGPLDVELHNSFCVVRNGFFQMVDFDLGLTRRCVFLFRCTGVSTELITFSSSMDSRNAFM